MATEQTGISPHEKEVPFQRIRRLRREGDVSALIAELQKPRDSSGDELRAWIVRALGKMGDPRAVEPLARLVSEDLDETVAATAAWALGEIGGSVAISTLMHAIEAQSDVVKAWAADGLGKLERYEAAPRLVQLLSSDHRPVRLAAAQALGRIGDPSMIPALSRAAARERWSRRGIYRRAIRCIRSRHEG